MLLFVWDVRTKEEGGWRTEVNKPERPSWMLICVLPWKHCLSWLNQAPSTMQVTVWRDRTFCRCTGWEGSFLINWIRALYKRGFIPPLASLLSSLLPCDDTRKPTVYASALIVDFAAPGTMREWISVLCKGPSLWYSVTAALRYHSRNSVRMAWDLSFSCTSSIQCSYLIGQLWGFCVFKSSPGAAMSWENLRATRHYSLVVWVIVPGSLGEHGHVWSESSYSVFQQQVAISSFCSLLCGSFSSVWKYSMCIYNPRNSKSGTTASLVLKSSIVIGQELWQWPQEFRSPFNVLLSFWPLQM